MSSTKCECCGAPVILAKTLDLHGGFVGMYHQEYLPPPMTDLEKLVLTWRYWDLQVGAATTEEWAEFHDQFLAAERALKDEADRLAKEEGR